MPGYRKGEESFFGGFYGNLGYRKKLPSGRIVASIEGDVQAKPAIPVPRAPERIFLHGSWN